MLNAVFSIPKLQNEPVYSYAPGSQERELIIGELKRQSSEQIEIPPKVNVKPNRAAISRRNDSPISF